MYIQYSSLRGKFELYVRRSGLFPQLTWSTHPFKYILQIRDSSDNFCNDDVLETIVVNVSQPSMLETMIVLHCVQVSVGIGR